MNHAHGYTVLELLITLAVSGLLLTLAIPSFADLVLDARLTATVNRVVHGMHVARQEALKSGTDVVLCRSPGGLQCDHNAPWNAGLIIFLNRDRDDPPRVDPGEPVLQVEGRLPVGSIQANRRAFIFRPSGLRSVNGTLTFCDRRGTGRARAVVVSYTGRPRATSAATADGASKCPV